MVLMVVEKQHIMKDRVKFYIFTKMSFVYVFRLALRLVQLRERPTFFGHREHLITSKLI